MPIRYAVALYGAVWLFLILDARLHRRSAARPLADACAVSGPRLGTTGQPASLATPDCATGRR